MFSTADAARITALAQSSQESDAGDAGAPDAAVYKSHSGDIVDTLQDLMDKAQAQLAAARKKEANAIHDFQILKLSLEDQIKFDTRDLDDTKADLAASAEKKSVAESSLAETTKCLPSDVAALEDLKADCAAKASAYEALKVSIASELTAIAEAKKALSTSEGTVQICNKGKLSFLQIGHSGSSSGAEIVRFVRDLAKKQHSTVLAQLAARMASVVRFSNEAGEDPFAKVKDLISDLIAKLEGEQDADATHKAYCDKELSETKAKKAHRSARIEKLSVQIEQMTATSAKLKEETAATQKALADLAKAQADMDMLRGEENAAFMAAKADMEEGLNGVRLALKILKEFAGCTEGEKQGAATSIIGMLEVVEADFEKRLIELADAEETAAAEYEAETKDNGLEKVAKEKDVEYKTQEAADLDKSAAEATSDRSGVQAELDAVLEYLTKLEKMCIAKPETYAERKRRRDAEIAGLKEALKILEGDAMLLQTAASSALRGVRRHAVVQTL